MKLAAAGVLLLSIAPVAASEAVVPDPEAAARQYRVARRLAAERSADAAAAFAKVLELDPGGPLGDDALVEQALLLGSPGWPEELGDLRKEAAARIASGLNAAISSFPRGDRIAEARYRLTLLKLEPLPGRDAAGCRLEMVATSAMEGAQEWGWRARYVAAWIDERQRDRDRAAAAYQRLVLDAPDPGLRARALAAVGRIALHEERPGRAAALLQSSIEAHAGERLFTEAFREAAVRGLLREVGRQKPWGTGASWPVTSIEGFDAAARGPDGKLVAAGRRAKAVAAFDSSGRPLWKRPVDDVAAVTVDPWGRVFAAVAEGVVRIDASGVERVASIEKGGASGGLSVDDAGRIWALDRRGEVVYRIDPGSNAAVVWGPSKGGSRLAAIAWETGRLLAVEARGGRVIEIRPGREDAVVAEVEGLERATALAVGPGGEIAVLDGRTGDLILLSPSGRFLDRLATAGAGVQEAVAVAVGPDGTVDLLDAGRAAVMRVP